MHNPCIAGKLSTGCPQVVHKVERLEIVDQLEGVEVGGGYAGSGRACGIPDTLSKFFLHSFLDIDTSGLPEYY